MPSSNKTSVVGLNQWTGNEYIKRQDLVDDNQLIDNFIKALNDALLLKADKTEVIAQYTNLIGASPDLLNTIYELSAALGNDPNFATTVANLVATKAPINNPIFTGIVQGITAAMVGLGNVNNTSDANKPVSTAQAAALALKADLISPLITALRTAAGTTALGSAPIQMTAGTLQTVPQAGNIEFDGQNFYGTCYATGQNYTPETPSTNLIIDQTYEAVWKNGTLSANPTTDVFTLAAHGFSNGDPIEFDANTGALPTGITGYASDNLGGVYYNVINATTDTFQVTATVGSSAAVDFTDAGIVGFRCRLAGINSFTLTGLTLASDKAYRITLSNYSYAKKTTGNVSCYCRINGSTAAKAFCGTGASYAVSSIFTDNGITGKYSEAVLRMLIDRISASSLALTSTLRGQYSNDKVSGTALNVSQGAYVVDIPAEMTSLSFATNDFSIGLFRNGIRVQVWRAM